jgi:hypothetical protein
LLRHLHGRRHRQPGTSGLPWRQPATSRVRLGLYPGLHPGGEGGVVRGQWTLSTSIGVAAGLIRIWNTFDVSSRSHRSTSSRRDGHVSSCGCFCLAQCRLTAGRITTPVTFPSFSHHQMTGGSAHTAADCVAYLALICHDVIVERAYRPTRTSRRLGNMTVGSNSVRSSRAFTTSCWN